MLNNTFFQFKQSKYISFAKLQIKWKLHNLIVTKTSKKWYQQPPSGADELGQRVEEMDTRQLGGGGIPVLPFSKNNERFGFTLKMEGGDPWKRERWTEEPNLEKKTSLFQ